MTTLPTLGILLWTAVRVVVVVVVAKLLTLGILFLTSFILALRAVVVAKLVLLGISLLTSLLWASRVVLVSKLVISDILFSVFLFLALHIAFLTTSFFATLLSLLQLTGKATNLLTSNLST